MINKKYLLIVTFVFFCFFNQQAEARLHTSFSLNFFGSFFGPPRPVMIAPVPVVCQGGGYYGMPCMYEEPMVIYQPVPVVQYVRYARPCVPCTGRCGNPARFAPY